MKKHYDFSQGTRGPVIPPTGKTRISIYLDNDIVERFKALASQSNKGYQTLINDKLREALTAEPPLTESRLREVLSEIKLAG